jgi:hypothetical protein
MTLWYQQELIVNDDVLLLGDKPKPVKQGETLGLPHTLLVRLKGNEFDEYLTGWLLQSEAGQVTFKAATAAELVDNLQQRKVLPTPLGKHASKRIRQSIIACGNVYEKLTGDYMIEANDFKEDIHSFQLLVEVWLSADVLVNGLSTGQARLHLITRGSAKKKESPLGNTCKATKECNACRSQSACRPTEKGS